jgi:hypothetical protein
MLPWVLSSRHILRSDLLLRKIEGGKAWEELKDNLDIKQWGRRKNANTNRWLFFFAQRKK